MCPASVEWLSILRNLVLCYTRRLEAVNVEYNHGRTVTTGTSACHPEVDANNNLGFPRCHDIVLSVKTMLIATIPSSNATTIT